MEVFTVQGEVSDQKIVAVCGVGLCEILGQIFESITVGIGIGFALWRAVVSKAGDAPGLVSHFVGGFAIDPVGDELDGGLVRFGGGQGGHAGVAIGGSDPGEEDGSIGLAGHDQAVVWMAGPAGGKAVDQAGPGHGEIEISFP